jgi:copper chaperone
MQSVSYTIPNISCKHCTHTIAMELSEIKGVAKVDADIQTHLVRVDFDAPATEQQIKKTLAQINYPAAE